MVQSLIGSGQGRATGLRRSLGEGSRALKARISLSGGGHRGRPSQGRGLCRRVVFDGRREAFGVLTLKTKRLACPHQTPPRSSLIEFHESPRLQSGAFAVLGLISLSHRSLQGTPRSSAGVCPSAQSASRQDARFRKRDGRTRANVRAFRTPRASDGRAWRRIRREGAAGHRL